MASVGGHRVDFLRKGFIVALLFAGLVLLFQFASPTSGPEATGLLALGFVVLAAFTIGELVEVVKLPHITGYLLAGLVLGPSLSHTFHLSLPAPFDHGVLSAEVIHQLGILDTLALPLICLTAGGALNTKEIRRAIRPIMGILVGQTIFIFVGCIGLFWLISGPLPFLTMPQLVGLELPAILALGAVVASVSLATSDAATIAIVVSTRSRGPLTTNALSVAVLKDVLVVICFSASTAFALSELPTGVEASFTDSLTGIGLSIVMGLLLGGGIHLYLRYIKAEVLLFLVAMIYTMSFVADALKAESALMFIMAGFVAANYSPFGEKLIKEVERLSAPVFVVFFTLAGAKLHLDVLASMAAFGLALVVVRAAALYIGCRLGAVVGGADPMSKKYVWLSYLSQAGLAITLANDMPATYGESIGGALFSFLLAGVAIHELIGPAALQFALDRAGEIPKGEPKEETPAEAVPAAPTPVPHWKPLEAVEGDPWGTPVALVASELQSSTEQLEAALRAEVDRITVGPLTGLRRSADQHLQDLRQIFLDEHRRLCSIRRQDGPLAAGGVVASIRIAEQWRRLVFARSSGLEARAWDPQGLVQILDRLAENLPDLKTVPLEPMSLLSRKEGRIRAMRRFFRRTRSRIRPARRKVSLRDLGRYHLSGRTPARLESVVAAPLHVELRIAQELERVFLMLSDRLCDLGSDPSELDGIRRDLDGQVAMLSAEITRLFDEGERDLTLAVGEAIRGIKSDLEVAGTMDLPSRQRRYGRVFHERNQGQRMLRNRLAAARDTVHASAAYLQLQLELFGFSTRIRAAGHSHAENIQERVRAESVAPLMSVDDWLESLLREGASIIAASESGDELSEQLRAQSLPLMSKVDEAARGAAALQLEMQDARPFQPLLETIRDQAQLLTSSYSIPATAIDATQTRQLVVSTVAEVPLRKMVVTLVDTAATRKLMAVARRISHDLGTAARQLEELDQIIPFNVDLASAELETFADAAIPADTRKAVEEMLLGALGRSHARTEQLASVAVGWPESFAREVIDVVEGELNDLLALLSPGKDEELRQVIQREEAVRATLARRAEAIGGVLARTQRDLSEVAQSALGPERLSALRRWSGLPVDESVPLRTVLQPPTDICPAVYRRLFTGSVATAELVIGRQEEVDQLRGILKDGSLRAAAIVGPKGAGGSSLATLAMRGQGRLRRLNLSRLISREELDRLFSELGEGETILIDGFHWLFTPEAEGTAPLQRLIAGVLADGGRNAWVVSANEHVWAHACRREPLAEAFPTMVHLRPMDGALLQQAILTRHAMSGYALDFEAQEDVHWQWRVWTGRSAQEAFFEGLHAASGGITRDALRLWLAAVQDVDDAGSVVRVGAIPQPPRDRLSQLSEPMLLTLRLALLQGWVRADIHASLFCSSLTASATLLERMQHDGLLVAGPDGTYMVADHLHTPIAATLNTLGWL